MRCCREDEESTANVQISIISTDHCTDTATMRLGVQPQKYNEGNCSAWLDFSAQLHRMCGPHCAVTNDSSLGCESWLFDVIAIVSALLGCPQLE